MRFVLDGELLVCDGPEAEQVLTHLLGLGYQWLQDEDSGGHKCLWDRSGAVCVGERWQQCLWLDGRVREDVQTFLSGFTRT